MILTILTAVTTVVAVAQESHYHRSLRAQDTDYGLIQEPHFNGSGMFWSRTRNVDDVAIIQESKADSLARREDFKRLCRIAYDAYDARDAQRTVTYGDSALCLRYHTPELYFYMAVAYEKLGIYDKARRSYSKAHKAGYPGGKAIYKGFKKRLKRYKSTALK